MVIFLVMKDLMINIKFVSGVVLANAALDVAFHDTLIILFFAINKLMDKIKNDKLFLENSSSSLLKLDNDYIKKF
jgi:hypothetical protein